MDKMMKKQNIESLYRTINCFLLVGIIFALLAGSAYCITLSISPTISLEEGELKLDRLKMAVAGEFFGVDTKLMLDYRQRGFHPEDIVTALFFSGDSQRPLSLIFILRKGEEDWSRVAGILGLPPNAHGMQTALTHGKGKKVGLKRKLASEGYIFLSFISDYYKIEMGRLWFYIEKEFTLNDILLAVNLGAHQGISFELLLRDRERGLDWSMILRQRNIPEEKLFSPFKSEKKYKNKPVIK
ncbi:MAG: hypothetical protein U9O91_02820 [Candidatus Caldatribacteriota bacterium]|nr:hypothetical protein [Candidatus Caldatribacteriota bacterium]